MSAGVRRIAGMVALAAALLSAPVEADAAPKSGGSARPVAAAKAAAAKAPAAAPSKRAAPTLNDRAIRLMIANFMEGHWVFRTIFGSGAPKLEATEIVGPIAVPSASGKEVHLLCFGEGGVEPPQGVRQGGPAAARQGRHAHPGLD